MTLVERLRKKEPNESLDINVPNENSFQLFCLGVIGVIGAGCLTTLALNLAFDPLWYFGGNKIGKINYSFNERLSKAVLYSKNPSQYDCIIFGSSRTTLLNEKEIQGYDCFNFSFAGGRVEEFIVYANWIKQQGISPKKVIFAVEHENIIRHTNPLGSVPKFILEKNDSTHFLEPYTSLSTLKLSLKTLFGISPRERNYSGDFTGILDENLPIYEPSITQEEPIDIRFDLTDDYQKLLSVFPDAKFVGYVPPLSPWQIASRSDLEVETFLETVYSIAGQSEAFYDFSIPSEVTKNTDNTYDGSHYNLDITGQIAESFNSQSPVFGIRVDGISKKKYFESYQRNLIQFELEIR